MGIQVAWDDNAHTCVRYDVRGTWTLQDMNAARHTLEALIADRQDEIVVIIDVRESQFMPQGLMVHFGNRSYSVSGQIDLMVFVGASGLLKRLTNSYQQIYRKRSLEWRFASNLDDARRFVQEYLQIKQANRPIPG